MLKRLRGGERSVSEIARGMNVTRLEHRKLDRYAEVRDQMRGILDGEGGWTSLLDSFVRGAEA